MPTNEYRREVAQRLREIEPAKAGYIEWWKIASTLSLVEIDHWFGWEKFKRESVLRLADLIDPEPERTCDDVSTEYGEFECSRCGCKITDTSCVDYGGIHFCPDCGSMVNDVY